MSASAPHSAKLIANVAILTPDRALLVKYGEGHDGDGGWMLPDDLLADGEHPDYAAARVLREHLGMKVRPVLAFVDSFTGGDDTWHIVFNYVADLTHGPPIKPGENVTGSGWLMLSSLPGTQDMAHRGWAADVLARIVSTRRK
ncbi:MAG: NUDIX domain-containing protein [Proteobacteria bacterium]|nr:NUDIX domain-containing protein [Pseudomonadota bacterium]